MRIGVISDTHGRLRPETAERLKDVDCILHAGDFDDPIIMQELDQIAPLYGVRGNNDWPPLGRLGAGIAAADAD